MGIHPSLAAYLGALVELGVNTVKDFIKLEKEFIKPLHLWKLHIDGGVHEDVRVGCSVARHLRVG